MSCDYCTSSKSMMRDSWSDVSIGKVDDVYRIYYSDGYRGGSTEPIRFCPMCGDQLPYNPPDSLKSIRDDMALNVASTPRSAASGREILNAKVANGRATSAPMP